MSESILLLNPRPRRRRKNRRRGGGMPAGLRRHFAKMRRARGHKINRRRRRINRRTPVSAVARRARRRAFSPRRRARRRRAFGRLVRRRAAKHIALGRGIARDYIVPAAIGAAGSVTLDVIWGYVSPKLPTQLQSGWFSLATKLAVVLGVAYGVTRFRPSMRAQVHTAALGAATVAFAGALKGMAQSVLPASVPGLSGYMDYHSYALPGTRMAGYMPRGGGLGDLGDFYSPAAVIQPMGTPVPRQFGGYIAAQPMAGYMSQPHMSGGSGLMGYDWQNDGM